MDAKKVHRAISTQLKMLDIVSQELGLPSLSDMLFNEEENDEEAICGQEECGFDPDSTAKYEGE